MLFNYAEIRKQFLIEEGITYLNTANMSPLLTSVKEAGIKALDTRAHPWRITAKDWFNDAELVRAKAAAVFGSSPDDVALVPGASYGLAAAARNLTIGEGKSILVLKDQFPSNYYVWRELAKQQGLRMVTVEKQPTASLTQAVLQHIDASTGVVALPNCHWITGDMIDLEAIGEAARSAGAYFVLDLSQSLGVLPVAIKKIDPDFAVSVGYKWMLGPYGLGYLYVAPRWQQGGQPLEYSWLNREGSEDFSRLTQYTEGYRSGARRFDMGEFSQFHTLPMAAAALDWILGKGVPSIVQGISEIAGSLIEYRNEQLHGKAVQGASHIISLPVPGKEEKVKQRLAENKIVVSFRGDRVRVSTHLFNTPEDIGRLLSCLV